MPSGRGHVQAGSRPVIVLQSPDATRRLPTVIVVPLTGAAMARRFPGTVIVVADAANGLRVDSVALAFQAGPIDKQDLRDRIGRISASDLQAVFAAWDAVTGRMDAPAPD